MAFQPVLPATAVSILEIMQVPKLTEKRNFHISVNSGFLQFAKISVDFYPDE